jgi:predicted Zn-dependent protease with MMP-like domain
MDFETLSQWADEEVNAVMKILPLDVQKAATKCSIAFEGKPGHGAMDSELSGDELGLFEGVCLLDEPAPEDLPVIRIFVENIWEWVEEDERDFRDEVGTTFLHELGHYLGWDEDEVAERGLE